MKLNKKKVFVTSLAVCLIAILSLGTVAWFNAEDSVTNKFKIADSDGDGTPDFSVDVWETDPENPDPDAKDQDGVTYEDILPGDVIAKNPTVENTGDYDQWIRVYVTFNEFSKIEAACQRTGITSDLRTWLDVDASAWIADNNATVVSGDTVTYVYYYNYKLVKDQTAVLFNRVTIPGAFEQQDMEYVSGDFSITIKAEAIQADNTGDTAMEAFKLY
ncbi:MAG: hypothetical protein IJE60_09615 [Tyzzerella sp.]|nr:hypothetical protein [Tyzzerella sp.]